MISAKYRITRSIEGTWDLYQRERIRWAFVRAFATKDDAICEKERLVKNELEEHTYYDWRGNDVT